MRRRAARTITPIIVVALLAGAVGMAFAACADGEEPTATGSQASVGSGGRGAGGGGGGFDPVTSGAGAKGGSGGTCAAVHEKAEPLLLPADIVLALDGSGDMVPELAEVKQNLNHFADSLAAAGVDMRLVLLSDDPTVCIPPPLGSGSCPDDENLPGYRRVEAHVYSGNLLYEVIHSYDEWSQSLRPNAVPVFLAVSDTDSTMLSAKEFTDQLLALDPVHFEGFVFDAVVAPESRWVCEACTYTCGTCAFECCDKNEKYCQPLSDEQGFVYEQLVTQTFGILGSICKQDLKPVFEKIAAGVAKGAISCEFVIPPTPPGLEVDPGAVNVAYVPGQGPSEPILFAEAGLSECDDDSGGWYYDDAAAPTKVILCPASCNRVRADPASQVDVLFGCDTVPLPPD